METRANVKLQPGALLCLPILVNVKEVVALSIHCDRSVRRFYFYSEVEQAWKRDHSNLQSYALQSATPYVCGSVFQAFLFCFAALHLWGANWHIRSHKVESNTGFRFSLLICFCLGSKCTDPNWDIAVFDRFLFSSLARNSADIICVLTKI